MEQPRRQHTDDEREFIKKRLAEPFPAEAVTWVVEERTPDGRKGKLLAYVHPRLYTDRLNEVVGPSAWRDRYTVKSVSGMLRTERNGSVQSGKIFVQCRLWISGLGTKPGSGERWADEKSALARAESQALRRACSRFGLGRYLYELGENWVSLDQNGRPAFTPELPNWAVPGSLQIPPSPIPTSSNSPIRPFLDMRITSRIESFRGLLGEPIYAEILRRAGQCQSARAILTRDRQIEVLRWMEEAARRINRVKTLTRRLGTTQLLAEMSALQIGSAISIPSLQALTLLLENMESSYGQRAA